ncbi:MAG: ABC transporter substrate-binding protein [Actinomycetota bacterium]|nr:ABC transporter substrate-binding protein [Actinomycetota bacterium]
MPDSMERREFLRLGGRTALGVALGATSGSALLAACGTSTPTAPTAPNNGVSTARPRRGGSLVMGVEAEEQGFDPRTARFDSTGILYARTVYDPLTIIAADGSIQPYLAEAVTPNADFSEWTIRARHDVVFHDDTTFDAQALYANFTADKAGLLSGLALASMEKVSIVDAFTVKVTMKQPWVPFDVYLAGGIGGQFAWMVSPQALAKGDLTSRPVGTGPFVFEEWVPGSHFTSTANPHYWRPGLPYLAEMTYKPIPNDPSRLDSLLSGAIDIMHTDIPDTITALRSHPAYGFVDDAGKVVGEVDMDYVMLNTGKEPFNHLSARQALAYGIDYDRYLRLFAGGVANASNGPFDEGTPFYGATGYPTYDPAKARAALARYRQETGKDLTFTLGTTSTPFNSSRAQLFQSMWDAIGVSVNIAQFAQNQFINNQITGDFQASLWRQGAATDPDMNYVFWSPTTSGPEGGFATNFARETDPRIETALQTGRTNGSPAARATAYQTVARVFAEDLPYLWLDRDVWAIGARPGIENFNNPSTPTGGKGFGMISGIIWPTEIWISS